MLDDAHGRTSIVEISLVTFSLYPWFGQIQHPFATCHFLKLLLLDLVRLEMVCMPHQIIPCLTSECTETAVIRKFINLVCSFIRWSSTLYIWPMKGDSLRHFRHFQNFLLVFILTASDILKRKMQGLKIFPSFVNFFSYRFILTGIVHQALLILKFLLMIYYLSV